MSIIVSKQDAAQVLRLAFDDATQSIRTSGSATAEQIVVQPDGSQLHVTVDESALPVGAATEAKQDTQIATLDVLSDKTASALVTVPFDSVATTYVASGNGVGEIETVVYKLGATVVATLTLSYDSQNRLTLVTRT
jgi:hypothetical protein